MCALRFLIRCGSVRFWFGAILLAWLGLARLGSARLILAGLGWVWVGLLRFLSCFLVKLGLTWSYEIKPPLFFVCSR